MNGFRLSAKTRRAAKVRQVSLRTFAAPSRLCAYLGMTGFGIVLSLASPILHAQDYGNNKPPPEPTVAIPLTAEEKAALVAVDVRIGGLEALAAKIEDDSYRSNTLAAIADMK